MLLAAGANVNDTAPYGTSALIVAAHSGNEPVALLLVEKGADPNSARVGYTAVHAAILKGEVALAKALLERNADPHAPVMEATYARRNSADSQLPKDVMVQLRSGWRHISMSPRLCAP